MKPKSSKRGRPPLPEGEAATEQIQLRVQPARRKAYMLAKLRASPDPKKPISLVKWIFNELDRAAGYEASARDAVDAVYENATRTVPRS